MTDKINRRDFMTTTAGAGILAAAQPFAGSGPAVIVQGSSRPVVISSNNGHRFKNGGTKTCVETAFEKMMAGTDVLDALIAGVNIVELDPEDSSVGYGGLPNGERVRLDASCMHGPTSELGGWRAQRQDTALVAKARAHGHPARRKRDAQAFAHNLVRDPGPQHAALLGWPERKKQANALPFKRSGPARRAARRSARRMVRRDVVDGISTAPSAATASARGATSAAATRAVAWKIPGRLGDSPISAGLYVDGDTARRIGAAAGQTSTVCAVPIVRNAAASIRRGPRGLLPDQPTRSPRLEQTGEPNSA
jgi:N4-(beta-N-acetylglucosaminyl)-L-asparaginase